MPQDDTTEREKHDPSDEKPDAAAKPRGFINRKWLLFLISAVILLGGFTLLYFGLDPNDERTKFWTPNVLNILLLMVIVVQAFIAARQWEAMERQWEAMNQQAALMNRQLDTATLSERAYVGVHTMKMVNFTIGQEMTVKVGIENGGRTPAAQVVNQAAVLLQPDIPAPPLWNPSIGTFGAGGFMPAQSQREVTYTFTSWTVTAEIFSDIESGKQKLFIAGEVRYSDVLGRRWSYKYCARFNPHTSSFHDSGQSTQQIQEGE